MHEYPVTVSIVDLVSQEAQKAGVGRVTEIRLVIGDLSSIMDESVQMYFDIISKGTPAEGARLVFRRVAAQFRCKQCGLSYDKPKQGFDCPRCGGPGSRTGVGTEFYIESIEVE